MKTVVFVAMFALVAIQLCRSAPLPDEEKKAEAVAEPAAVPLEKVAGPPVEVKAEEVSASEGAPRNPESVAAVDEKKA